MRFKILSFDGGGMRSLMTALLIENLDAAYDIINKADGFIGTSSGGLIALALAKGVPIANIIHIYQTMGPKIFTVNPDAGSIFQNDEICTPARYKIEGLELIADQLLGKETLDSLKKLALVTSHTISSDAPEQEREVVISNGINNQYAMMTIKDAALATAAIPSYFPPYNIEQYGDFANRRTLTHGLEDAAILQAVSMGAANALTDLRLLSIGVDPSQTHHIQKTQQTPHAYTSINEKTGANTAVLSPAKENRKTLSRAARTLGPFYCRSEINLPQPYAVDNWKSISDLMTWTYEYMASKEWNSIKKWVSTHW